MDHLEGELKTELKNPRVMSVHRMEKRASGQAVHSTPPTGRIVDVRPAVTPDDVIACIPGVRRVVDSELSVVENVERFGAEFDIALAENFEMLQQGDIEICATRICDRVSSATSERQPARSSERSRSGEDRTKTLRVISPGWLDAIRVPDTVCV